MSYVDDSFVFLLLFVLSFAICGVIVLSQSLHIDRSTRAEDLKAIQAVNPGDKMDSGNGRVI